jgi:hypothetical protein
MSKTTMTAEEIIAEIEQLRKSPYVKFAKAVENKALRQKLYQLRSLDKKGRELAAQLGVNLEG